MKRVVSTLEELCAAWHDCVEDAAIELAPGLDALQRLRLRSAIQLQRYATEDFIRQVFGERHRRNSLRAVKPMWRP